MNMNNMNPNGMVGMPTQMGGPMQPQQQMGGPPQVGMQQGGMPQGVIPQGVMQQGVMNPAMQQHIGVAGPPQGGMPPGGMVQPGVPQNTAGPWQMNSMGNPAMNNPGPMNIQGGPHQPPMMMNQGPQGPPNAGGPPPGQVNPSQQDLQQRFDNVAKVRSLVSSLKDSLSEVVRVAAMNIYQTAAVDNGMRSSPEGQPPRLDKALEDFFSICNQIEFNLKTIQECIHQYRDSQQYLPIPVQLMKTENSPHQDNVLSYGQYVATIGAQVAFAKQVQEILTDSANRMQQQQQAQPMFH